MAYHDAALAAFAQVASKSESDRLDAEQADLVS
jgi:hypothetical protein